MFHFFSDSKILHLLIYSAFVSPHFVGLFHSLLPFLLKVKPQGRGWVSPVRLTYRLARAAGRLGPCLSSSSATVSSPAPRAGHLVSLGVNFFFLLLTMRTNIPLSPPPKDMVGVKGDVGLTSMKGIKYDKDVQD